MIGKFDIDIVYHDDGVLATGLGSIIEQAKDVAYRAVEILDSLSSKLVRLKAHHRRGGMSCGA